MYDNQVLTELTTPKHLISLSTSAVLVSVDVKTWTATKQDSIVADEVTDNKKADRGSGKFVKSLLQGNMQYRDIINCRQKIYNWLSQSAYRWNHSQDLVPTIDLPRFTREFSMYEDLFNVYVEEFIKVYPQAVSNQAMQQGDLYDSSDYPSAEEVRRKFSLNLYVSEVPEQDFRCQISNELARDLKINYQRQTEGIVKNVLSQQIDRVTKVMESISHCCGYKEFTSIETGEVTQQKRKIYGSTLQKAKELCETYSQFKLIDNEDSRKLNETIESLGNVLSGVSSEQLKESTVARKRVKEGIDEILNKFI
jgi:hypothetical protein|tara:strand:- start:2456 stop:3382 length:927 start_codon:yes stop_codon:yes gene_type:complete